MRLNVVPVFVFVSYFLSSVFPFFFFCDNHTLWLLSLSLYLDPVL